MWCHLSGRLLEASLLPTTPMILRPAAQSRLKAAAKTVKLLTTKSYLGIVGPKLPLDRLRPNPFENQGLTMLAKFGDHFAQYRLFELRADIRSHSFFRRHFRALVMRTDVLVLAAGMAVFSTLLMPGQYLIELGFLARLVFNILTTATFLFWTWLSLGSFIWWCVKRNIPWYWAQIVFYFPLGLATVSTIKLFINPLVSVGGIFWIFVCIVVNIILIVTLAMHILRERILATFAISADTFPYWKPTLFETCRLQELLPPERRGTVLRIDAANQYVQVFTEKGEALIRISLNEASELLPQQSGLRVHRSHWVARQNMAEIWFENGNPRLKDGNGEVVPVSRNMADKVRLAIQN